MTNRGTRRRRQKLITSQIWWWLRHCVYKAVCFDIVIVNQIRKMALVYVIRFSSKACLTGGNYLTSQNKAEILLLVQRLYLYNNKNKVSFTWLNERDYKRLLNPKTQRVDFRFVEIPPPLHTYNHTHTHTHTHTHKSHQIELICQLTDYPKDDTLNNQSSGHQMSRDRQLKQSHLSK